MSGNGHGFDSIPHALLTAYAPHWLRFFLTIRESGWDNSKPRQQLTELVDESGIIKRAFWAHLNGLEIVPFWTAAVLMANAKGVSKGKIERYTKIFLASRWTYNLCYLISDNKYGATARTIAWVASVHATIALMREAIAK